MANNLQITKVSFSSIEDMQQLIPGTNLDSVQLNAAGLPKGGMLQVVTPEIQVGFGQFHAKFRSRGIMHPDRVTFGIDLGSDAKILQWGLESLPGDVFTFPPGSEQDSISMGDISFATLSVGIETLIKYGANDIFDNHKGVWEHPNRFRASARVRSAMRGSLINMTKQLRRSGFSMSDKQLGAFQHDLIESFLQGVVHDEKQCVEQNAPTSAQIVRKAEHWMDGQLHESVHVADLCRVLNVSRRSLQRAFNEIVGMGPAHYLKLKRMAAVRVVLRNSDPFTTTVSEVAMDHGFWELGRFAVEYRYLFGEKPSETLNHAT